MGTCLSGLLLPLVLSAGLRQRKERKRKGYTRERKLVRREEERDNREKRKEVYLKDGKRNLASNKPLGF